MNFSRRSLLKLGAGSLALGALGSLGSAARAAEKKIPIGLQLYSVRQLCEKDLAAVLKAVAEMGYDGVEFAGYYGHDGPTLKKLLDDNGLKCCGAHTAIDTLSEANFAATVDLHKTLENKYLIVPWLPENYRATEQAWLDAAKMFDALAAKAKESGMYVGYHAHGGDFVKIGDRTGWDIFFSALGPDVVMQLDTGNCLDGGGDPIAVLKKFPGRSKTIHLKEHGGPPAAPVGEGTVPWKEVFEICETTGGTEWYIVEHESGDKPLESVAACLKNLRTMGK